MINKTIIRIVIAGQETTLLDSVRLCKSLWCRLIGLQFHRPLKPGEGILLVKNQDTITASSIHMFFVFFPIAAVWINGQGIVTHKALALPWRPYYASPIPARYVLETTPDFLGKINIGDQLIFI